MTEPGDHGLLDFNRRSHRVKGKGLSITLSERLRAARRIPQAVVKVTSFSHGLRQLSNHLRYITRSGKIELEKDTGEILAGEESRKDLAAQWATSFDTSKCSRDAAHIVFSMPKGSDVQALRRAVRATGARAFEDNEWVFAIHEDRDHPHAHMVVKMRSRDLEKKLRLRKADLYELRQMFAEAARDQGVQLSASPRASRGVGRRGQRQTIIHIRQRAIPKVDRELVKEISAGRATMHPWDKPIRERHHAEKTAYFTEGETLRHKSAQLNGEEREKLIRAANDLTNFARVMPEPKTRRQIMLERILLVINKKQTTGKVPDKDRPFQINP